MVLFPSDVTCWVGVAASEGYAAVGIGGGDVDPVIVHLHTHDAVALAAAITTGEHLMVGMPVYGAETVPLDDGSDAIALACFRDGVRRLTVVSPEVVPSVVMAMCDAVALCEGGVVMEEALSAASDRLVQLATQAGLTSQYPLHLVASGMGGLPVD